MTCHVSFLSILASQLRADWSVTLDRLDNKYYVTWGSSLTASATPAGSSGKDGEAAVPIVSGGSLPPQGKMLGKLDQKDFKQVIAKGMKTYGMFQVLLRLVFTSDEVVVAVVSGVLRALMT